MDTQNNPKGIVEKLAHRYIKDSVAKNTYPSDEPHLLNEHEIKTINRVRTKTLVMAAVIGTLGVLFLYLPQYFMPFLFPVSHFKLFGSVYDIEIVATVYGIALIWPELWALNYINLKAVKEISLACVYPRPNSNDFDFHVNALTDAGLEKEDKGIQKFGLNPYLHIPKAMLWAILIVNRLKATLSNMVIKIVIKRILGRYAVRQVTDLAGIPIFAFWNAWASDQVITEAKFRIMAPMALSGVLQKLQNLQTDFSQYIFSALQFSVAQKRKYNYAQFYWSNLLHQSYSFKDTGNYSFEVFNHALKKEKPEVQKAISIIIVCSMVIDGKLSLRERKALKSLHNEGWLTYNIDEILNISKSFNTGKGLLI